MPRAAAWPVERDTPRKLSWGNRLRVLPRLAKRGFLAGQSARSCRAVPRRVQNCGGRDYREPGDALVGVGGRKAHLGDVDDPQLRQVVVAEVFEVGVTEMGIMGRQAHD